MCFKMCSDFYVFGFGGTVGLDSGLCICKAGTLPLEPHLFKMYSYCKYLCLSASVYGTKN
jgi:hypothetical protein